MNDTPIRRRAIVYGVMVSACVLVRAEKGRFDAVVKTLKQFKEAKRVFAVLGRYDVVVDLEAANFAAAGAAVLRMGQVAGVVFTETLVEVLTRER